MTAAGVATSSGTAALFTALNVMGIGPGDEVLVPPYTFVACVNVILMCHALPVFVDTDPETFQIDARKIEVAITGRTRAILAVHLGGATFDVDAVRAVAKKHNLPLLEDSCQSHLAEWRGHLMARLRRQVAETGDPALGELAAELAAYPGAESHAPSDASAIATPLRVRVGDVTLNLISTVMVFGAAREVTLSELAIETFLPADPQTAEALRRLCPVAAGGAAPGSRTT